MNMPKISSVFIIYSLPCVMSLCIEHLNISNAIARNRKLSGSVFRTHSNVNTWLSCARLCLLRSLCKSFNYNEETQECEINWKSASIPLDPSSSWLYGEASKIPQRLIGECAFHSCQDHQICGPQVDGGHSCLDVDECPPVSSDDNINYKLVNGVLDLSCKVGLVGVGHNLTRCSYGMEGFSWNLDFSCCNTTNCYVKVNGTAVYTGTMAVNIMNDTCENWSITDYTDAELEPFSVSRLTNYCRDVDQKGFLKCPSLKPILSSYPFWPCRVSEC